MRAVSPCSTADRGAVERRAFGYLRDNWSVIEQSRYLSNIAYTHHTHTQAADAYNETIQRQKLRGLKCMLDLTGSH
jgi:hypothetical protein